MSYHNVLNLNKKLLLPHLAKSTRLVDATAGNGYDSEFLLAHSPAQAVLYCCDIQEKALQNTRMRVENKYPEARVHYYHGNHLDFFKETPGPWDVVMFNLGYLPGGDHTLHTQPQNTVRTLVAAAEKLALHGLISLVAYPGSPIGAEECRLVGEWLQGLDQKSWEVVHIHMYNQLHQPPELWLLEKRSK